MATENPFVKLFAIDFKDHLEVKKSGNTELKYVSWAYAWAEVKKLYPSASYEVKKFNGLPYVYDPITGFMVYTSVTIEGISHEMWLPVLDGANKAMKATPYTYTTPKWEYNQQTRRREKVGMEERTVEAASIDRQIRNIKAEYPTAHIVQEAYTGTSIFRPEWLKLYRILKASDMVVFDSVSRMSRNAEEGFTLYEDLYHRGIRLVFLKEHHIDTETYKKALSGSIAMTGTNVDFILKGINEYLMALAKEQIKLAFEQSEKEVADLHQRTREGLLTARLNGKQVGRKKGVGFETKKAREAKQIIRTHCKTFGGTLDDMECMKLTGLARNTYYKYKRQIRADLPDEGKLKKEELL